MKIYSIFYTRAHHTIVARVNRTDATTELIGHIPWTPLPMLPGAFASLEVEETVRDGVSVYTARCSAPLCRAFRLSAPCAFLLQSSEGPLLMGLHERPHPLALCKVNESGNPSEATKYRLDLEWSASLPPLRIIEARALRL